MLISPRSAMDSDDAEGAELPPFDAKNIAGAGTKRRVDRAHDPTRRSRESGERSRVSRSRRSLVTREEEEEEEEEEVASPSAAESG